MKNIKEEIIEETIKWLGISNRSCNLDLEEIGDLADQILSLIQKHDKELVGKGKLLERVNRVIDDNTFDDGCIDMDADELKDKIKTLNQS